DAAKGIGRPKDGQQEPIMTTSPLKPVAVAILAASTAGLAGCFSSSSSGDGDGTLSLGLTDAPTQEFSAVNITVTGVELQPADGERVSFDFDEPKAINLLDYQNGESIALLEGEDIPAGDYNWMRLMLDTDNLTVDDNEGEKTLFIPSGEQTGLKTTGFAVAQGSNTDYTIDFDVSKSIVNPQGNNNADYFLVPVLRLVNNLETGEISGEVGSNLVSNCENDGGTVYVYSGADATIDDLGSDNEPLTTASVETDSETSNFVYTAAFLEEGDYTVSHTCDADDNEQDEELTFSTGQTVTVTAGETTELNLTSNQ
ncbi:MAG: DUF4382 domain-containing protein, partial [Pseudomonadota bacterium]